MRVATYTSERDNRPDARDLHWSFLVRLLTSFREGPCTVTDCVGKKCPHKLGPAWSPVEIPPGATRANRNVEFVTAAVFDLDHVVSEEWEQRVRSSGLAAIIHSTHTSRESDVSLRLVLALSRPVTTLEWPIVWRDTIERYGLPADSVCGDASRLYFMPSAPLDVGRVARVLEGNPLDVDAILAAHPAPAPAQPTKERGTVYEEHDRVPASPEVLHTALTRVMNLGRAVEGKGGDALTLRAALIAKNDFDLSDDEALDVLERWDAFNEPPWGAEGLRSKITNAERYASGETGAARVAREVGALAKTVFDTPAQATALGLPAPEPEPEEGSFAWHLRTARTLIATTLGSERIADAAAVRLFMTASDLLAKNFAAPTWLVSSLILEGGLAVVSTEPKAAKTWAATEIAIGTATGTAVFGRFPTKVGRVAYFYAEDLGASVTSRIRALCAGIDGRDDLSKLFAEPRGRDLDICNDEHLANLLASCWMIGDLALLVLDPLRNIHTGEEDSSDSMSRVMARLRFLSIHLNCTVLFVHHSKKQSADSRGTRQGQMMRGSSAIHGAMDSGIYFSNLDVKGACIFTNRVLSEVKGAKGAGLFDLTLTIEDDPMTQSAIGAAWQVNATDKIEEKREERNEKISAIDSRVLGYLRATPSNTDQIRARLRLGTTDTRDALTRLEQDGLIEKEDYLGSKGRMQARWTLTLKAKVDDARRGE